MRETSLHVYVAKVDLHFTDDSASDKETCKLQKFFSWPRMKSQQRSFISPSQVIFLIQFGWEEMGILKMVKILFLVLL